MSWRDRASLEARVREAVHDQFRIPVMFSADGNAPWRVVFCRFHEAEDRTADRISNANFNLTTTSPRAIFRAADVPDLATASVISVGPSKAYKITQPSPADLYGYQDVRLSAIPNSASKGYPAPDWDAING